MSKNQSFNTAERTKINQTDVFCAYDEIVAIGELKPNPQNPNTHPEEQIKILADIIKQTGWRAPITVSTRSGYIVKGHGRLMAAKLAGFEAVPVEYQNFNSEDEEKAALLADNKIAEFSEIDSKLLAQMFEEFDFQSYGDLTGYSESEYNELMNIFDEAEAVEDLDTVIEPAEAGSAYTKTGDIWILGRHKLICGDCRDTDIYRELMQNDIADMVMTDPPYNVDYEGATGLKIANDNMSDVDFSRFLTDCFNLMSKYLKAGGAVYCWHSDVARLIFQKALENSGITIKQNLIWVKNHWTFGRQDYQWKHEPYMYGWKDGAAHYFIDKRNLSTVLEYDKPLKSAIHPTMKPVDLFIHGIENSSRPGQIILDAFAGSGTTMIACEKLGRRARLIELSPEYCDAIVQRYLTIFSNTKTIWIRNGNEMTSPFLR